MKPRSPKNERRAEEVMQAMRALASLTEDDWQRLTDQTGITGRELAIPLASVLPLAMIAFGALGVVRDQTAVWLALAVGVATLAVQGVRYARIERLSRIGAVVSVALNLSFGLLIVAVKVVLAH